MHHDLPPDQLPPDERTHEVAAILAIGLRRLRDRAVLTLTSASQNSPESLSNELAKCGEKSVTVHGG